MKDFLKAVSEYEQNNGLNVNLEEFPDSLIFFDCLDDDRYLVLPSIRHLTKSVFLSLKVTLENDKPIYIKLITKKGFDIYLACYQIKVPISKTMVVKISELATKSITYYAQENNIILDIDISKIEELLVGINYMQPVMDKFLYKQIIKYIFPYLEDENLDISSILSTLNDFCKHYFPIITPIIKGYNSNIIKDDYMIYPNCKIKSNDKYYFTISSEYLKLHLNKSTYFLNKAISEIDLNNDIVLMNIEYYIWNIENFDMGLSKIVLKQNKFNKGKIHIFDIDNTESKMLEMKINDNNKLLVEVEDLNLKYSYFFFVFELLDEHYPDPLAGP